MQGADFTSGFGIVLLLMSIMALLMFIMIPGKNNYRSDTNTFIVMEGNETVFYACPSHMKFDVKEKKCVVTVKKEPKVVK